MNERLQLILACIRAENDDEYTAWVLQYKKQIKTEQKLLNSLKKTSWDSYKKLKERENVSI